ncbi:MAG: hypothetical protein EOP83_21970 [Verrucomicrobiaceae bacterium]|nr:MAG: hypothetical protein EOP83_21970 [Verrucomicrobiaceae bacterium]
MLIENKALSVNDIATVRLVSGEEIVGRVTAIRDSSITITKPVHVLARMVQQDDGSVGAQIQFAPFMYSVAEAASFEFDFKKLALAPIKTNTDVATSYRAMTSDIVQPKAPGLLIP